MEICYLSFGIKTNIQSMQIHKLQINKTPNPKINEPYLTPRMWKRQFLNRFRFQHLRRKFCSKFVTLENFWHKVFSRYVKIKRFILSSSSKHTMAQNM